MLSVTRRLLKKVQMQGARALRNEAYEQYAAVTKGEVQRRRWAFFSDLGYFIRSRAAASMTSRS